MNKAQCIAVIPARGGSKRVIHKNRRPIAGKPMIGYTIEAALQSGIFDRVIVSTDEEQIAEVAISFGAEVPFMRTASIADDHTPVSVVTVDALRRVDSEGSKYEYVAQLMANCPLRTSQDLVSSHDAFMGSGAAAQLSVTPYGWQSPWWAMELGEKRQMQPLFAEQLSQRSQDLPELYCPTGAIWWAKTKALREHETFYMDDRVGWVMSWQGGFDIDTEEDFLMAELLLKMVRDNAGGTSYV